MAGLAGTVGFEAVDALSLPSTFPLHQGSWTPCEEGDGELPQVEGMVADSRRGVLYAAQEDVGFWRIPVSGHRFGDPKLFDRVREFGQTYTRTFDPEDHRHRERESTQLAGHLSVPVW